MLELTQFLNTVCRVYCKLMNLRSLVFSCAHTYTQKTSLKQRLLNCLPGQRKLKTNESQVKEAAKFIVDRFGIPTVVEEEEEVGLCVCVVQRPEKVN